MPMDPFSAEIVALVRRMSDEAILALVRNQLEAVSTLAGGGVSFGHARRGRPPGRAAKIAAPAPARGARSAKKSKGAGKTRHRSNSAEREQLLAQVEKIVKGGAGISASETAKNAGLPQARVATALKELKLAKLIFQGGDRRFARYAGDAKTAEQASMSARKNAAGPARPPKAKAKAKAKAKKRGK
jgi:hypothetical protein